MIIGTSFAWGDEGRGIHPQSSTGAAPRGRDWFAVFYFLSTHTFLRHRRGDPVCWSQEGHSRASLDENQQHPDNPRNVK